MSWVFNLLRNLLWEGDEGVTLCQGVPLRDKFAELEIGPCGDPVQPTKMAAVLGASENQPWPCVSQVGQSPLPTTEEEGDRRRLPRNDG